MAETCRYLANGKNTGNVPVCLKMLHEPKSIRPSGAGELHTVQVKDPIYHETITAEVPVCIPARMTKGRSQSEKLRRISQCEGFASTEA